MANLLKHIPIIITFQIISLLDQARESSNNTTQVVQLLDKVEDMLRTPELYSPHVKEDSRVKSDEPVVSDLISALLSVSEFMHFNDNLHEIKAKPNLLRHNRNRL